MRLAIGCALLLAATCVTAQVRSSDGRLELAADDARGKLIARDVATGAVVRELAVIDRDRRSARVARIVDAAPRRSFVVLLADAPEAWELSYDPDVEPVYEGLVHDFRLGEGIATRGPLARRRIELDTPLADALFAPDYAHFVGRAAAGELHVVNLDVRRRIETVRSDGDPRPAAGAAWREGRSPIFAVPDAAAPRLLLLDGRSWRWRTPLALPAIATAVQREADGTLAVTVGGATLRVTVPAQ
ncbi:MAG TPA: hypothetical protein VNK91_11580 [Burkholderiaceae bacterium]|jgi:hypothetical protein|nr:hypothetical protein [Burkholderiaceae bacterium]